MLCRVIQNRDNRRLFAPWPFCSIHLLVRLVSARLGSGPLGLAWLRSAWVGLARLTTRSHASARGSSAREQSPSESHACQRRPAQIMVGCVERRGGGCGGCEYETRGRRRSFLVAYVVSSLLLPLTRSIPLPRSLARSLGLCPRLDRQRRRQHKNRRTRCFTAGRGSRRYPWLGLGRGAIWRTVRRANECPRWPLRATRTTMGDTERALPASPPPPLSLVSPFRNDASFRSVYGRLPSTQPFGPSRSTARRRMRVATRALIGALAERHPARRCVHGASSPHGSLVSLSSGRATPRRVASRHVGCVALCCVALSASYTGNEPRTHDSVG